MFPSSKERDVNECFELSSVTRRPSKFITTVSGIKYKNIVTGKGAICKSGDKITVNYNLWLGKFNAKQKVDSSSFYEKPFQFILKKDNNMISGWNEIFFLNMKIGTKRYVIIPPDLGYGEEGVEGIIPPNSTLYFEIELLSIDNKA
uniref:peptidylprolyl isomerase n=1 Tax=viral metagenome TaxID=1070528 RepID=A0A6C0F5W6_9ZZZZ